MRKVFLSILVPACCVKISSREAGNITVQMRGYRSGERGHPAPLQARRLRSQRFTLKCEQLPGNVGTHVFAIHYAL